MCDEDITLLNNAGNGLESQLDDLKKKHVSIVCVLAFLFLNLTYVFSTFWHLQKLYSCNNNTKCYKNAALFR